MRILLVEDHADTRNVCARLFMAEGHFVHGADTIAEALALMNEREYDLLVCDIEVPDGNACQALGPHLSRFHLGGIIVSAHGMQKDVETTLAAGFAAHLVKPLTFDAIMETIDALRPPGNRANGSRPPAS